MHPLFVINRIIKVKNVAHKIPLMKKTNFFKEKTSKSSFESPIIIDALTRESPAYY
jgi:hypothetical protein